MSKFFLVLMMCCAFSFYVKAQEIPLIKYSKEHKLNVFYDKENKEYVPRSIYISRYGKKNLRILEAEYKKQVFVYGKKGLKYLATAEEQKRRENNIEVERFNSISKPSIRLKSSNIIAGSSLIGTSLSTYLISNTTINHKITKTTDADKITSLNRTNRIISYSCAGVSLTGVIIIMTGIKKDYSKGLPIANNLYLSDKNKGISLSFVF